MHVVPSHVWTSHIWQQKHPRPRAASLAFSFTVNIVTLAIMSHTLCRFNQFPFADLYHQKAASVENNSWNFQPDPWREHPGISIQIKHRETLSRRRRVKTQRAVSRHTFTCHWRSAWRPNGAELTSAAAHVCPDASTQHVLLPPEISTNWPGKEKDARSVEDLCPRLGPVYPLLQRRLEFPRLCNLCSGN